MSWFYAKNGQQQGPVTDADLSAKVASGEIRADTLVWRAGMPEWKTYREVAGVTPVPAAAVPMAVASTPETAAPDEGPKLRLSPIADTQYCSECGRPFPGRELVSYGNRMICAECKPVFFQRLAESGETRQQGTNVDLEYAGFWIRWVAKFVDALVLMLILAVIGAITLLPMILKNGEPNPAVLGLFQVGAYGLQYVVWPLINGFFVARYGASPGKMALGLRVVRPDGSTVSGGQAYGRAFAELLSNLICSIGYIIAAFDNPEKRALHDRICDTRVVYKRSVVSRQ